MVTSINNLGQSFWQPKIAQSYGVSNSSPQSYTSLNDFSDNDQAIISAEAKYLNEIEKFNSGNGDAVNFAITGEITKFSVAANVNAINAKKDAIDAVLDIGKP